jgi:hypothetical protein
MDRYGAEQLATSQLDQGESLLWCGVPNAARGAIAALPATLIGIPFAGFAAFWTFTAYSLTSRGAHIRGPWALFPLFGTPFLLIGLGLLTAPLWAWLAATRTVYAVTNRRALILVRMGGVRAQSYTHEDIGELSHVERGDGSGDLYFASRTWVSQRGSVNRTRIGFVGIPEVRTVEQLIRSHLEQKAA